LRFPVLTILLISISAFANAADSTPPAAVHPTAARYKEGLVHGFLELSTLDGVAIAAGDLNQVARGDQVTSKIAFRFKDGSRQEETTVFTQRGVFRLVSYRLVQKGPSFKNPSDLSISCATGQVTVRYTDNDGKEKVDSKHMNLPPDLANGLIPTLLKNLRKGTSQLEVPMVVAAPKLRLVKVVAHADGTGSFSLLGFNRDAVHYVAKIELGGVAGVVAPIAGKQPPDSQIWIVGGEAPGFLRSESPAYAEGPMWRIELVSPVWPQTSTSASKNDEGKH
jgi:hypothetical protein